MSKLEDRLVFKHYLWNGKSEFCFCKREEEPFSEIKEYIINNLNPFLTMEEAIALTSSLENLSERDVYLYSLIYTRICLFLSFITMMVLFAYMIIATGPFAIVICILFFSLALGIAYWEYSNLKSLYAVTQSIIEKNNHFLKEKCVKIAIPEFNFWKGVSNEIEIVKYNL
jgi:hypothetical protein